MEKYIITGMSCAACSARVEKAVSSLENVDSCSVNLLTNSMTVEGTAAENEIISAVVNAGYGAEKEKNSAAEPADKNEYKKTLNRLGFSIVLLAVLMYFSMGRMIGLPLPESLDGISGIIQMILSFSVMLINRKFFINGFKGIIHRSPNMDTLVSLGSGAAFGYSVYSLVAGNGDFYFESAAMILTLITVGKMLEEKSKGRTADAVRGLMKLAPDFAHVIRNGKEETVSSSEIVKGDVFVVKPGESIPADGIVIKGLSAVNESALTGESIPSDKEEGSRVSAGTVNGSGYLECTAEKTGSETFLSQIIQTVSDASASKAPIARIADKVSAVFVPAVMIVSLITLVSWLIAGKNAGFAVARAISVLVISCPCSLGLATPVAIMAASGVGAKNGILFKTAASIEEAGRTQAVIFDKTGTLTKGELSVTDIIPKGIGVNEFLGYAASVENQSEHPIASAIVEKAKSLNIEIKEADNFKALAGSGVEARIDGNNFFAGRPQAGNADVIRFQSEGKTVISFSMNNNEIGLIALSDSIREDSRDAVSLLHSMGISTVMLTGDNAAAASVIAKEVGIDEVISDVLPAEKEKKVASVMQHKKTAMVGDGINDAPALTRADTGIAIGAGTDIAIDSADIVLMNSSPSDAAGAIKLGRAALKNIRENLFWAFFYNIIGIPVAAGILIKPFGIELNPMIAAAAMSLSSFCVVTNALRLNRIKLKDKKEIIMKKTISIEGMMCTHCEARVKTALEALDGVESAQVSHEKGNAVVSMSKNVPDEFLKETIEVQGYKVI